MLKAGTVIEYDIMYNSYTKSYTAMVLEIFENQTSAKVVTTEGLVHYIQMMFLDFDIVGDMDEVQFRLMYL